MVALMMGRAPGMVSLAALVVLLLQLIQGSTSIGHCSSQELTPGHSLIGVPMRSGRISRTYEIERQEDGSLSFEMIDSGKVQARIYLRHKYGKIITAGVDLIPGKERTNIKTNYTLPTPQRVIITYWGSLLLLSLEMINPDNWSHFFITGVQNTTQSDSTVTMNVDNGTYNITSCERQDACTHKKQHKNQRPAPPPCHLNNNNETMTLRIAAPSSDISPIELQLLQGGYEIALVTLSCVGGKLKVTTTVRGNQHPTNNILDSSFSWNPSPNFLLQHNGSQVTIEVDIPGAQKRDYVTSVPIPERSHGKPLSLSFQSEDVYMVEMKCRIKETCWAESIEEDPADSHESGENSNEEEETPADSHDDGGEWNNEEKEKEEEKEKNKDYKGLNYLWAIIPIVILLLTAAMTFIYWRRRQQKKEEAAENEEHVYDEFHANPLETTREMNHHSSINSLYGVQLRFNNDENRNDGLQEGSTTNSLYGVFQQNRSSVDNTSSEGRMSENSLYGAFPPVEGGSAERA